MDLRLFTRRATISPEIHRKPVAFFFASRENANAQESSNNRVGILLAEPSLLEIPQGTMIINEKMIKRLPHQK